ncbi:hypothetical protein ACVWXF_002487 [Thermostichus sp. MS-CIW-40]
MIIIIIIPIGSWGVARDASLELAGHSLQMRLFLRQNSALYGADL